MSAARQLTLDLGRRPALGRAAYLVSPANAEAVAMVEDWPAWPAGRLALTGAAGAGKSHLARVWAEMAGARILPAADPALDRAEDAALLVEDVPAIAGDAAAEARLFHLANAAAAREARVLFTGRGAAPRDWGLTLPDLASRVAAGGHVRLGPPDEALLAGVLVKLFADRQIRARPQLIGWLTRRIERSFPAAEAAVARLDAAALAQGRPVGVRLAAEVLGPGAAGGWTPGASAS